MGPGLERLIQKWGHARLAHEAVMMEDAQKLLAQNRRGTALQQARMAGVPLQPEEDSMIHIGDKLEVAAPFAKKGLSLLLGAVLAMSGLGGGLGLAALLLPRLSPPTAVPAGPQDFKVDFWMDQGKLKTEVTPLPVPKP